MKYLKKFENSKHNFNVGDYVYFKESDIHTDNNISAYKKYLENNIGEIVSITDSNMMILYENVPKNIKLLFIHYFDKSKNYYVTTTYDNLKLVTSEEVDFLKMKKDIKKYNL